MDNPTQPSAQNSPAVVKYHAPQASDLLAFIAIGFAIFTILVIAP